MICDNCHKQATEGDTFCSSCGKKLDINESVTNKESLINKILKHKKSIIVFILIIGLGIVFSQIFSGEDNLNSRDTISKDNKIVETKTDDKENIIEKIFKQNSTKNSNYEFVKGRNAIFYDDSDVFHILDSENFIHTMQGEIRHEMYSQYYYFITHSRDGETTSFIATDDNNRILWLVAEGKMIKIAEEVDTYYMSDDGKAIAYIKDVKESKGTLWLYNCETEETTMISEEVFPVEYIISPDGKTVGYNTNYNEDNFSFESYIWEQGKNTRLANNTIFFAISNNGEYVYYTKLPDYDNAEICVQGKDGEEVVLLSVRNDYLEEVEAGDFVFNKDYSQIIYSIGNISYISIDGGERQTLCNEQVSWVVTPDDTQFIMRYPDEAPNCAIYGINGFNNIIIGTTIGDRFNFKYINENFEAIDLFNDTGFVNMSKDGKTLIFMDLSGNLYRIRNLEELKFTPEKVAEEIAAMTLFISNKGTIIYYSDFNGDLWCIDEVETKRIASNVRYDGISFDSENEILFYTSNNEDSDRVLYYYSNDDAEAKKVEDIENALEAIPYPGKILLKILDENDNIDIFYGNTTDGFKNIIDDLPLSMNYGYY